MKKSLLALAVLGAFAGAASAQTNVTIYGVVDAAITRVDNDAATTTRLDSGKLNGSRLGFRGTEDLGGGLSAIFTLENGFDVSDGTLQQGGRLFGRQAFVGLSGGFGAVKFGRQNTPVYANAGTFDPFGNALAGDSARIYASEYEGSRFDNAITYNYSAAGFRGELQYALGEVAGNNSANRAVGGFVGYRNGPIDVVLTYTDVENAAGTDDRRTWLLGGNYNFGFVKPFLSYASTNDIGAAEFRTGLVGLTAPIGTAGTLIASYGRRDNRTPGAAGANDSRLAAIGYKHDISKRTALYTSYGRITNDGAANLGVGGTGGTPAAGRDANEFNVGVRHTF